MNANQKERCTILSSITKNPRNNNYQISQQTEIEDSIESFAKPKLSQTAQISMSMVESKGMTNTGPLSPIGSKHFDQTLFVEQKQLQLGNQYPTQANYNQDLSKFYDGEQSNIGKFYDQTYHGKVHTPGGRLQSAKPMMRGFKRLNISQEGNRTLLKIDKGSQVRVHVKGQQRQPRGGTAHRSTGSKKRRRSIIDYEWNGQIKSQQLNTNKGSQKQIRTNTLLSSILQARKNEVAECKIDNAKIKHISFKKSTHQSRPKLTQGKIPKQHMQKPISNPKPHVTNIKTAPEIQNEDLMQDYGSADIQMQRNQSRRNDFEFKRVISGANLDKTTFEEHQKDDFKTFLTNVALQDQAREEVEQLRQFIPEHEQESDHLPQFGTDTKDQPINVQEYINHPSNQHQREMILQENQIIDGTDHRGIVDFTSHRDHAPQPIESDQKHAESEGEDDILDELSREIHLNEIQADIKKAKGGRKKKCYIETVSKAEYFLTYKMMNQIETDKRRGSEVVTPMAMADNQPIRPMTTKKRYKSKALIPQSFNRMNVNDLIRHERGILNMFNVPRTSTHNQMDPGNIFNVHLSKGEYDAIFDNPASFYEKQALADIFRKKWKEDQGYCSLFQKRTSYKNAKNHRLNSAYTRAKQNFQEVAKEKQGNQQNQTMDQADLVGNQDIKHVNTIPQDMNQTQQYNIEDQSFLQNDKIKQKVQKIQLNQTVTPNTLKTANTTLRDTLNSNAPVVKHGNDPNTHNEEYMSELPIGIKVPNSSSGGQKSRFSSAYPNTAQSTIQQKLLEDQKDISMEVQNPVTKADLTHITRPQRLMSAPHQERRGVKKMAQISELGSQVGFVRDGIGFRAKTKVSGDQQKNQKSTGSNYSGVSRSSFVMRQKMLSAKRKRQLWEQQAVKQHNLNVNRKKKKRPKGKDIPSPMLSISMKSPLSVLKSRHRSTSQTRSKKKNRLKIEGINNLPVMAQYLENPKILLENNIESHIMEQQSRAEQINLGYTQTDNQTPIDHPIQPRHNDPQPPSTINGITVTKRSDERNEEGKDDKYFYHDIQN